MPTEFRVRTATTPFEVREYRRLCWYAATFDQPYRVRDMNKATGKVTWFDEVVKPGSFSASLKDGREVEANVDHDTRRRFALRSTGELLLQEDPKGLWASVYLPKNDLGDGIMRDIEAGVIGGASFRGEYHPSDQWTRERCVITQVPLVDVCITATPANPNTEVRLRTKKYNEWLTALKILELVNRYR